VRQYLKVHEGAPEAGVARETTTVKKVAEFGELFDTLLTTVKKVAKFSELFDKGQTMGEPTSVQSKTKHAFCGTHLRMGRRYEQSSSAFSDYVDRMDCADFAVFASPSMSPNAAVGHSPVTPSSYDFNWTSAFGTLCFRHQLHRRTFASGFLRRVPRQSRTLKA
jgi:hypothetical protein